MVTMQANVTTQERGSMKLQQLHTHHHKKQRNEDHTEFFFISSLSGMVPTTSDTWFIDSGASKHMIGYKENLSEVVEKESHLRVVLGDDAN